MEHSQVEIVAAAPGTIFDKADGYDDRSCTPGGQSNKIAILHADGTRAWYIHMKKWSLTPKGIGETVAACEYLGVVGSSGNSGIPHLHFDLRDENWDTFDPYGGPCNSNGPASWWADQRPYYDSAIVALLTHSTPPVFPPCPEVEILNLKNEFSRGDSVYSGIYHRDFVLGQVATYMLLDPAGAIADSGSYGIQAPFYAAAFAMPGYQIPDTSTSAGTWTVVVDYDGEVYEHEFEVDPGAAISEPDSDLSVKLIASPNPFGRSATIHYVVPSDGYVSLSVYDTGGRLVRGLADRHHAAGRYDGSWDGLDASGHAVAPGVYFARLELHGGKALQQRMVLIR